MENPVKKIPDSTGFEPRPPTLCTDTLSNQAMDARYIFVCNFFLRIALYNGCRRHTSSTPCDTSDKMTKGDQAALDKREYCGPQIRNIISLWLARLISYPSLYCINGNYFFYFLFFMMYEVAHIELFMTGYILSNSLTRTTMKTYQMFAFDIVP